MAYETEAMEALKKRIEKVANKHKLDVSVVHYVIDEKPALQIVFGVRPDAVKSAAALEQEKIDAQFEDIFASQDIASIFGESSEAEEEEEDDYSDVMKDLGDWLGGDSE